MSDDHSDRSYRTLFDTMGLGFCEFELIRDAEGRAIDQRYLEFNQAFERIFGVAVAEARGRKASEIFPSLDPWWTRSFDEIVKQGQPSRLEHKLDGVGRWFEVFVHPREGDRLIVLYQDVTERRKAEIQLHETQERQAFLLRFSDALRAEPDEPSIKDLTVRMLAEHLSLDRFWIAEVFDEEGISLVGPEWIRPGLQPMSGTFQLSHYPETMRQLVTQPIQIPNVADDPGFSEMEKGLLSSLEIVGLLVVPLRKGEGHVIWALSATTTTPRVWTDNERLLLEDVAERTLAAIQHARAEAAARKSEERLRLIVESARDYAIYTMDVERNVETWLPGAEAVFGWTREEIEGRSGDILFTPEDRSKGAPETEAEKALADGQAPDVRWHLHKDGSRVFIEGQSVPLFEGGKHTGFLKIGQDVTERRAAQEALRESEERLRQFGEASQDVLWIRDFETMQWLYLNPAFEAIYGLSRNEAMRGDNFRNWLDTILPEDQDAAISSIEKVRGGERVTFEYRIRRSSDGEIRWLRDTSFPIFGEAGQVRRIGGIGQDITDDKETADRMAVLVAELQHRTRNLIAVVRATADMTGQSSTNYPDFQHRFRDRLDALARVQGLLSRLGETDRVAFDELIRAELQAMHGSGDRVALHGPKGIRLRSSMVQTLAMALHELATNAVKYGALAQPNGHLAITWKLTKVDEDGRRRLHIDWRESGVVMPPVDAAPQGGGQGRELIEQALPYQLDAETTFELGPNGVRCTITIPISETNMVEHIHE